MFFQIKTMKEAEEAFRVCLKSKTQRRENILERWNELFLLEIEKFYDNKEIARFFNLYFSNLNPPSGRGKDFAEQKLSEMVSLISDSYQAKSIYYSSKWSHPNRKMIEEKWETLSCLEIEENKECVEYLEYAIKKSFPGKDSYQKGIITWAKLCEELEDLDAFEYFYDFFSDSETVTCDTTKIVFCILHRFVESEAIKAKDVETIERYYYLCTEGSKTELLVFKCWSELCQTEEDYKELFELLPKHSLKKEPLVKEIIKNLTT